MMKNNKVTDITWLEQGRAAFAYSCAEEGKTISHRQEYKSYVKKLPMLIKANGLGPALAFVSSRKKKGEFEKGYAYKLIIDHITGWLQKDTKQLVNIDNTDIVNAVIKLKSPEYRAVTVEVLAYLTWLRRFADSLIGDD